ncbi:hypothetical protein LVJ94_47715 [Pendulispora rubella]|uniref:Glycosyltransferase RgtA/B/C/D-like domain-containing protein n=1 Tax=Pendulispora rubella TaxID=2741070 RepID=A0ABZ2L2L7_9BACT
MDTRLPCRIARLLVEHPRFPLACLLLALLVALPSLDAGFFSDDFMHLAFLQKRAVWNPSWWDLYRFTPDGPEHVEKLVAQGMYPWWATSDLALHFFRPLTSTLVAFDFASFGHRPLGYHVHTIVWWLALVGAVALVYRQILPRALGHLALLLFALDDAHALPIAWVASRHLLVGAVLSLLGFGAHVRFRERGFHAGRWLGPLGLALGLAASEAALGVAAYWLAYEWLGRRERGRLRRSLPLFAVLATYAIVYRALGCGARESGAYVDPGADPVRFLATALERLPIFAADALLGVPADLAGTLPRGPVLAVGLLALVGFAGLLRAVWPRLDIDERRTLTWLAAGSAMSAVLTLGGILGSRLLLIPSLGILALIATVILHGVTRLGRAGAGLLFVVHALLAPLVLVKGMLMLGTLAERLERTAETAELTPATQQVVVLAAIDPLLAFYPSFIRRANHPERAENWFTLSAARAPHRVTRTGPASLRLEVEGTTLLKSTLERAFRRPEHTYAVGDVTRVEGMRITVAAAEAGAPTALDIALDAPLEDPHTALLARQSGALRRVTLAVGETLRIVP